MISFSVDGDPRPRQGVQKNRAGRYFQPDDDRAAHWLNLVYLVAQQHRPEKMLEGPLGLSMTFRRLKPKSWPKRRNHPDTKPDWVNLTKHVEDRLQGIFFKNDSQVCNAQIIKIFADRPGVDIQIWELDE